MLLIISYQSGCEGIDTRMCTVDSECSCFGIYFCIQGSCQMKGATPTKGIKQYMFIIIIHN